MSQDNKKQASKQENTEESLDSNIEPVSRVGLVGDGHHSDLKLDPDKKEQANNSKQEDGAPVAATKDAAPATEDKTNTSTDETEQSEDAKKDGGDSITVHETIRASGMFFYRNKPIFGLDIGYGNIKVMQINHRKQANYLVGYGETQFDPKLIKEGVITDPGAVAEALDQLVKHNVTGKIDFERAVMSIPASRTFIRSVILPIAASADLHSAVQFEIEQYTPLPLKDMYMDYVVINKTEKDVQLLVVAVPRTIADSYLAVAERLKLEVISIEPTLTAISRIFAKLDRDDVPTVIIDLGTVSSDVIVYDKGVVTAGSVPGGGSTLSQLIADKLHITHQETSYMKNEYGIGPGYAQGDILSAIKPQLEQTVQEVRRVIRYYTEHFQNSSIGQIVVTGGGSNLRGLDDYLTDILRVPTRTFMPWNSIQFNELKMLSDDDRSVYITAGGLALTTAEEVFK